VSTWTPTALASEAFPWQGSGWRAVEAQHRIATMGLAHGHLGDQTLLESILEESKPLLPQAAEGLHWLLATPFRYRPRPPGSRFRRRTDPGVFYGAEDRATAGAEAGYWRLRFWMDSDGLAGRPASVELTLFEFHAATDLAIDLTVPPLSADQMSWTDPDDYQATQSLAEQARAAQITLIRYQSVRRPEGYCLALLSAEVFRAVSEPYRHQQQGWSLTILPPDRIVLQRHLEPESWSFRFPA
jgi:hypothetical protein